MRIRRLQKLILLTRLKWNIPILAGLAKHHSCGFNKLANELNISKDSLNTSIKFLNRHNFVKKTRNAYNPRYTQYSLNNLTTSCINNCLNFYNQITNHKHFDTIFRRWSLPVIILLNQKNHNFSELKNTLPGITSRALSQNTKKLMLTKIITRKVKSSFPPTTLYILSNSGKNVYEKINNFYLTLA